MRIGCLLVPDLPLVAELRAHPELDGLPLAVLSEPGARATVLAASPEAVRAGVHPGQSLLHARAVCAELRVRTASPALERAAQRALLDVALSASPRAAASPSGTGAHGGEASVLLDAAGGTTLFGSEAGLAGALTARGAAVGLPAVASVASSRFLARLAARCLAIEAERGSVRVLTPDQEADFLAPLPVDLLDPDDALAEALTRLGIHRLGQLLALPRRALATRLGPGVQRLVARLRGEEHEPLLPPPRDRRLSEAIELEAPVERLEPLAFVLRGLLARLLARLSLRSLACGELDLTLALADGGRETRRLGLAAPTLDARVLLRRLRFALESAPPPAAVEGVGLATEGQPLRGDQLDLFRPAGPAPAELDALLAELEALCGPGRVGSPRVADDLRPDAFDMGGFRPAAGCLATLPSDPPGPRLAARALRPPVPAEVRLRSGRPRWLRSAVANGEVVHCAGPWRTAGGWWCAETGFDFDHFDVQTSDGLLVRLRCDRRRHAWQVDAVYD